MDYSISLTEILPKSYQSFTTSLPWLPILRSTLQHHQS